MHTFKRWGKTYTVGRTEMAGGTDTIFVPMVERLSFGQALLLVNTLNGGGGIDLLADKHYGAYCDGAV